MPKFSFKKEFSNFKACTIMIILFFFFFTKTNLTNILFFVTDITLVSRMSSVETVDESLRKQSLARIQSQSLKSQSQLDEFKKQENISAPSQDFSKVEPFVPPSPIGEESVTAPREASSMSFSSPKPKMEPSRGFRKGTKRDGNWL